MTVDGQIATLDRFARLPLMRRVATWLLGISAAFYVVSTVIVAFTPDQTDRFRRLFDGSVIEMHPNLIAAVFLKPQDQATWVIAVAVWLSVIYFIFVIPRRFAGERSLPPADIGLLIGALLAGAFWPWVAMALPLVGFLLCVTMLVALIAVSNREWTDGRLGKEPFIGVFTGWATVLTFAAFASFIDDVTPLSPEMASLIGAVLTCPAAMAIQMRMPGNAYYTITIMFAFLALAAAMINAAPVISVISVLAIAALTFLLVRVTT